MIEYDQNVHGISQIRKKEREREGKLFKIFPDAAAKDNCDTQRV